MRKDRLEKLDTSWACHCGEVAVALVRVGVGCCKPACASCLVALGWPEYDPIKPVVAAASKPPTDP